MEKLTFNAKNTKTIFNGLEYDNINKLKGVSDECLIESLKSRFNEFFAIYPLETISEDMKDLYRACCVIVLYKVLISSKHFNPSTAETIRENVLPNYLKEIGNKRLNRKFSKCLLRKEDTDEIEYMFDSLQWDIHIGKFNYDNPTPIAKRVKTEDIVAKILDMKEREKRLNVEYSNDEYQEMLQQEFGYTSKSAEHAYYRGIAYINARLVPGTNTILDMTDAEAIYFNEFSGMYNSYETLDDYAERNNIVNIDIAKCARFDEQRRFAFNGGFETYDKLLEYRNSNRDMILKDGECSMKRVNSVCMNYVNDGCYVELQQLGNALKSLEYFTGLTIMYPNRYVSSIASTPGYHIIPMRDIEDVEVRDMFCRMCEIYLEKRSKVPSKDRKHYSYFFCDSVIIPTYKHILEIHGKQPKKEPSPVSGIVESIKRPNMTKKDLIAALKELPDKTNLESIVRECLTVIFNSSKAHIARDTRAILAKIE